MFTTADIEKYFNAEKQQTLLFLVIGIAAIVTAVVFFVVIKTGFYKGAAVPLFAVGLLIAVVGFTVYKRSDADRIRNVYAYSMDPSQLKNKELPRMQKVMTNFSIYRWAEIVLMIAGVGLFFYFKNDVSKTFWRGFGCALAIMAAVAFAADVAAAKRGAAYTEGLQNFINTKFK